MLSIPPGTSAGRGIAYSSWDLHVVEMQKGSDTKEGGKNKKT